MWTSHPSVSSGACPMKPKDRPGIPKRGLWLSKTELFLCMPSRDSRRGGGTTAQVKAGGARPGRALLPAEELRAKQPPHTPAPHQTQPVGPREPVMEEMGRKAFVSEAWVWWAVCCLKGAWWCWELMLGMGTPWNEPWGSGHLGPLFISFSSSCPPPLHPQCLQA